MNNDKIEELYNKLDAQDKIINTQALEIARLKEENEKLELENKVLKEQMVAMVKPNYTYGVR